MIMVPSIRSIDELLHRRSRLEVHMRVLVETMAL